MTSKIMFISLSNKPNILQDEVVYVIENLAMSPDEICGFVIGDICGTPYNPYHEWRVAFPPVQKPPVPRPEPPPVSDELQILSEKIHLIQRLILMII